MASEIKHVLVMWTALCCLLCDRKGVHFVQTLAPAILKILISVDLPNLELLQKTGAVNQNYWYIDIVCL